MSITRVNPIGFALGDTFTAAQANGIDQNTTFGLDKRSGQTDTLASNITVTGTVTVPGNIAVPGNIDITGGLHVTGPDFTADDIQAIALHAQASYFEDTTIMSSMTVIAGATLEYTDNYPKLGPTHPDRNIVRRANGGSAMGISDTNLSAPSVSARISNTGADLFLYGAYAGFGTTSASNDGKQIIFDITPYLLHGAKLSYVDVVIIPQATHVFLPAFMPRAAVVKVGNTPAVTTNISGTITDTSATPSAYDATHAITLPCASVLIDKSISNFYVAILNEGGSSSNSGLLIAYVNIFQSVTEVSQG